MCLHHPLTPESYGPGLKFPLLCPQHWAQASKDNTPHPKGTVIINSDTDCQFFWNQRRHCKTVKHSTRTNTPTFWTEPGTIAYTAFEAAFHAHDPTSYLQRVVYGHLNSPPAEEEFVAEEQVNKSKHPSASEGANADDDTVVTSNVDHQSADAEGPCPIHLS